jgi:hypothetical protein
MGFLLFSQPPYFRRKSVLSQFKGGGGVGWSKAGKDVLSKINPALSGVELRHPVTLLTQVFTLQMSLHVAMRQLSVSFNFNRFNKSICRLHILIGCEDYIRLRTFLSGAFAPPIKIRSGRPSVCTHVTTGERLNGFPLNFILGSFTKNCPASSVFI